MLTNFTTRATALLVSFAMIAIGTKAQTITAYTQVYSANIKGGTAVIGNTSMNIVNNAGNVATAKMNEISNPSNPLGVGSTQYGNDNENMQFADIDGITGTKNSTSADLILPAGTNTIKYARLYWGGRISNAAITSVPDTLRKVKIKMGANAYSNVLAAATSVDKFAVNATETVYQSYSDITAFIQASGAGTYTVADVPATPGSVSGGGKFAGWSIVIAYENPASLLNSVRIYHGYSQIGNPATISVTLNDLNVPNNSLASSDATMSVMGWEGDGNLGATAGNPAGDYLKINNVAVANTANLATNFWNGSISSNGAYVTTKNPNYSNQMGIDIDKMDVGTGFNIAPNANSVTITFGTEADQYFPSYFAFTLRVKDPLVTINKSVADANGNNLLESNEVLTYTLTGSNVGPGVANNVYVVDSLPANVSYIPGSMEVVSGPGSVVGAQTDAVDLADNSFMAMNGTRNYVKFFLGTGSTNASGGTLQVGETYTVKFKVKGQAIPGSVANTATSYAYSVVGDLFTDFSTAVIAPAGGPLPIKLLSFTADLKNSVAMLNWATESELNNDHFDIERSEDGIHFAKRGTAAGNGTSGIRHTYGFNDELNTNAAIVYYRLKVVDKDGKISYTKVIPLRLNGTISLEKMSVYPNPFISDVKVYLSSSKPMAASFRVLGLDGRELSSTKVSLEAGDNIVVLKDMSMLPRGTYIVEVTTATDKFIKKIIKN